MDVRKFPHTVIANYIADALELEGAMSKEMEIVSDGRKIKKSSMTPEVITPESAIRPGGGKDNAYIIFGLERDDREDDVYKKNETMSLYIYTGRQTTGLQINRVLKEYLGDSDEVCKDLTLYQREAYNNENFYYHSLKYKLLNGPEPLNLGTEGGIYGALVLLQYTYTYEMNKDGISK